MKLSDNGKIIHHLESPKSQYLIIFSSNKFRPKVLDEAKKLIKYFNINSKKFKSKEMNLVVVLEFEKKQRGDGRIGQSIAGEVIVLKYNSKKDEIGNIWALIDK